jgi:hypothetical protein
MDPDAATRIQFYLNCALGRFLLRLPPLYQDDDFDTILATIRLPRQKNHDPKYLIWNI